MHRRLKERLIGAAVIVMAFVIFIPMILDDTKHTESTITESNIPAKPEVEFNSRIIPVPEAAPPEAVTPAATMAAAPAADATVTSPAPPVTAASGPKTEEIAANSKGDLGLTAWVVQLGSFTSEENAEKLNQELRKSGFTAFVEPLQQGDSVLYRVRVGPELVRGDAEKLQKQITAKLQLDGIIKEYP